ncbi:MAG: phage integrase SAM-like domain-containing protein [Muribaculaceae bacterium]|nr:phage integrase SAM-like domain-containing protein [Muribaculaceae bacterium]
MVRKNKKAEDIPFSAIDNAFVRDFHLFLRVNKKQEQNTANNHCKILKYCCPIKKLGVISDITKFTCLFNCF